MIRIYTDGAAKGNPGNGGYGVILDYQAQRKELAQGFRMTTNNRMELTAAIKALEYCNKKDEKQPSLKNIRINNIFYMQLTNFP